MSTCSLPSRIRSARRRGLQVSEDGFVATPDGPKHIDDMGPEELAGVVRLPWRVVIDTAEQQPFTFANIKADAAKAGRIIAVETVRRCLGRYPDSFGDYSLESDGWVGYACDGCFVERKSLEDCQSTLLGFADGHRDRFESELANLAGVIRAGGAALVVVECDLCELLASVPPGTTKRPAVVAKSLHRSVVSMWREYGVPWAFCSGRRLAEITTFRFLESFWKHREEK